MEVRFSPEILAAAPDFEMIILEADIVNGPTPDKLWDLITGLEHRIQQTLPIELVRHRPAIDATRTAYKNLGKDPNRYRPSAEALTRRAVQGKGLYRTLAVIDLINYLSLLTGHSIGAFDASHIDGDTITLGVGQPGEPYNAIGRGPLNIAGLPVYRDATGGIGTPTSDNERTQLSSDTRRLLVTFNLYGTDPDYPEPEQLSSLMEDLLKEFAAATNIRTSIVRP